jgi:transposase
MNRLNKPWPKRIGIDEHSFKKSRQGGFMEFASMIVDHKKKRVFELVEGRSTGELKAALMHIPGRERVDDVSLDLSGSFKMFVREFFPNAKMTADKFHVLRLLHPAINRRRKEITGDRRTLPIRRLLLRDSKKLNFFEKSAMYRWLEEHPDLKEIYHFKEAMHGFYRIKGYERAKRAFIAMTDRMGESSVPEIKTLRKTLLRWWREILNYFRTGLTNGRVEGFNGKAKLIKRKAYGYRSFKNYRLRVLNDCY